MAQRYCTRCGTPLQPGHRFCGMCGAPAPTTDPGEETMAADVLSEDDEEEDLLADWDFGLDEDPAPPAEQAPTETIAPRGDTAVLPTPPARPAPPPVRQARPGPGPEAPPVSDGFPFGATFALLGAVAVIASSVMPWADGPVLPRDVPMSALLDPDGAPGGPSMGIALLGLGTLGALVALLTMAVPSLKFLRRLIGLVTLSFAAAFVLRIADPLLAQGAIGRLPGILGPGALAAAGGAVTQLVAGRWFRQ